MPVLNRRFPPRRAVDFSPANCPDAHAFEARANMQALATQPHADIGQRQTERTPPKCDRHVQNPIRAALNKEVAFDSA